MPYFQIQLNYYIEWSSGMLNIKPLILHCCDILCSDTFVVLYSKIQCLLHWYFYYMEFYREEGCIGLYIPNGQEISRGRSPTDFSRASGGVFPNTSLLSVVYGYIPSFYCIFSSKVWPSLLPSIHLPCYKHLQPVPHEFGGSLFRRSSHSFLFISTARCSRRISSLSLFIHVNCFTFIHDFNFIN